MNEYRITFRIFGDPTLCVARISSVSKKTAGTRIAMKYEGKIVILGIEKI